ERGVDADLFAAVEQLVETRSPDYPDAGHAGHACPPIEGTPLVTLAGTPPVTLAGTPPVTRSAPILGSTPATMSHRGWQPGRLGDLRPRCRRLGRTAGVLLLLRLRVGGRP